MQWETRGRSWCARRALQAHAGRLGWVLVEADPPPRTPAPIIAASLASGCRNRHLQQGRCRRAVGVRPRAHRPYARERCPRPRRADRSLLQPARCTTTWVAPHHTTDVHVPRQCRTFCPTHAPGQRTWGPRRAPRPVCITANAHTGGSAPARDEGEHPARAHPHEACARAARGPACAGQEQGGGALAG
jgi:hypothetical protein